MTGARGCDVAIVGAGVAGLTAAVAMTKAGIPDGTVIELGAQWWWPNEPLATALVCELGIESFLERLSDGVWRMDGYSLDTPAHRFARGATELPRRLAELLPSDVIQLADPVQEIHLCTNGEVRVSAVRTTTTAANVVIAVPPPLAVSQIKFQPGLPPKLRVIAERTPVFLGNVVKVVALYEQPFWRSGGLPATAEIAGSGPFFEVHDHSGVHGRPPALFGLARAEHFGDQAATGGEKFTDQISRIFGPDVPRPSAVHICDWSRERYTSPPQPSPEATPLNHGAKEFQTTVMDRIHWASTETAISNAGHIEGAVRAGLRIAELLSGVEGSWPSHRNEAQASA